MLGGGRRTPIIGPRLRRPVSLEFASRQHFNLVLAANRYAVSPGVDRGTVDAKRPGQRRLTAVVGDRGLLSHDAIGLTCLTSGVKHSQRPSDYAGAMTDTLIGQRIAVRLEELGMLPTELASRCGVSRAAVSGWINGTTKNIRNDHLLMVADTLGLEIRWLISGKGPRLAAQAPPVNYDSQDLDLLQAPPEVKAIFRNILTHTQKH